MLVPETEIIVRKESVVLLRRVLAPGEFVIGRSDSADLVIDLALISDRHARLTLNYRDIFIEDLDSAHGTFVAGARAEDYTRVWPGQTLQLGEATIELRRLQPSAARDDSASTLTETPFATALSAAFRSERKYVVGPLVASGGMGAILDVRQTDIERKVAMKVMLSSGREDDLERFLGEAQITAELEHPNIVPVHELGLDEMGQPFYTMRMVEGRTLKEVLARIAAGDALTISRYPLRKLLEVFGKICDGVGFAHSKGVIHRDLKPENIMLGEHGEVFVMDWGLAKRLSHEEEEPFNERGSIARRHALAVSPLPAHEEENWRKSFRPGSRARTRTLAGTMLGTPQFMAPEQACGEVDYLDERTDVYALGAILYTILTLRPPVSGDSPEEVLEKVRAGEIAPFVNAPKCSVPHLPGRRIPRALAAVCKTALAHVQQHRYTSVAAMQRDLEAYQNGFSPSAENAGVLQQLGLFLRRHRAVVIATFVGAVLASFF